MLGVQGRVPGARPREMIDRVQRDPPDLTGLPRMLRPLVMFCLAKEAAGRCNSGVLYNYLGFLSQDGSLTVGIDGACLGILVGHQRGLLLALHTRALTLRHRDGTLPEVRYNVSMYRDAAGKVLGVFAAARDVTNQNQAHRAIANSKPLHRIVWQS